MTTQKRPISSKAKRADAKKGFDQCFELLQCFMTLEAWKASVKPEIAEYAIKHHGTLDDMYFDSRSDICKLALYCYDIWQGVENPVYGRTGVQ